MASLGMVDVLSVYLGDRLGYYRALAEGPATSAEIARRTGTNERYTREWLEQQAVSGILEVTDGDAASRVFALPAGHADALLNRDSLNYMTPTARMLTAAAGAFPQLLDAFRSGAGVSWAAYGADMLEGQGEVNRPAFLHLLPTEWLPAIPDVHARLQSDPPARVADIACGAGWSSIAIAKAYPNVQVDGLDLDETSIGIANENLRDTGIEDRVSFQVRDGADPALAGAYDFVTVFESVHDMSRPVDVLRAMRSLVKPDGAVLVVDERVAEEFTAPGDEVERLMYGWSVFLCLPAGMADTPSAATGTVMRPATLRRYAQEAGFRDVEVLPIEHIFFRFYRLLL
jgi:2-polyprenyl-3-methyl-5-hydroxy-6-metoxy-1,4-benzoquinol methylase